MKTPRPAAFAAAILAALIIIAAAGCGGGSKTQEVVTPYDGHLYGVETVPEMLDEDVPLDAWINVYWPDPSYPPPTQFTVRVEKLDGGNWGGIHTNQLDQYSDPAGGSWWFAPVNNFSQFTWYRIVITDSLNREAIVYFKTSDWIEGSLSVNRAAPGATGKAGTIGYRPAGAGGLQPTGAGTIDHLIKPQR